MIPPARGAPPTNSAGQAGRLKPHLARIELATLSVKTGVKATRLKVRLQCLQRGNGPSRFEQDSCGRAFASKRVPPIVYHECR